MNKIVVITGASDGLGRELGKILIANGYVVVCLSRSKPDYACEFIKCDLTSEEEVIKNAKLATIPSHNSIEAINSATIIALIIYYSRQKMSKDDIIKKMKK